MSSHDILSPHSLIASIQGTLWTCPVMMVDRQERLSTLAKGHAGLRSVDLNWQFWCNDFYLLKASRKPHVIESIRSSLDHCE